MQISGLMPVSKDLKAEAEGQSAEVEGRKLELW